MVVPGEAAVSLNQTVAEVWPEEMVAVVVSSANRCFYCLVAHGQAVRELSGDPELGEMLVMNYRVAKLDPRMRAMLDFAWKLTVTPWKVEGVMYGSHVTWPS